MDGYVMGAYLEDHPPAIPQFRCPRRAEASGVVVVHSAENFPDLVPADGGAEAIAAFTARRTDKPGSYHDVADSDSVVNLVRYDCEAFHDATGTNRHSYGVSFACRADDWPTYPAAWRDRAILNAAAAVQRYATWLERRRNIRIPARRITVAQARAGTPGFISHGELDPARRHDPWNHLTTNQQGALWGQLLNAYSTRPRPPVPPITPPEGTVPINLRVLRQLMRGGDVRSLQALLVDKAGQGNTLAPGAGAHSHQGVDGNFGGRTKAAVQNVQHYFGLDTDGVCGKATWPCLFL